MVAAWQDRTKQNIKECLVEMWRQLLKQVAQMDAKNQKNAGDNFYKMDEESIVTI